MTDESRASQAACFGGETIIVTLADQSTEEVLVRLVPVRELPTFLSLADDEEALAEFVCGKEKGWAATLLPGSLLDLADKALDLNFSNARRWAEKRADLGGQLAGLTVKARELQSALGNSVPMPPSASANP